MQPKTILEERMKINFANAEKRAIDNALTIYDMFNGENFSFDFVIAELDGDHPYLINKVSDRVYYFLEGNAKVTVGGEVYDCAQEDLVTIPKNTKHGLTGNAKYIVITSPPFNPENEIVL